MEVVGGITDFYTIYTLVDVTDSGVYNPKQDPLGFRQSQNLNVFMQLISLRTQPILSSVSILDNANVSDFKFGSQFIDQHRVWVIKFASSTEKAWFGNNSHIHFLSIDFNKAPVYTNLTNTANLGIDYIETENEVKLNTYFEFSENI